MIIFAWLMIGLAAGAVARLYARAGASHRLVITALFGVTGSLLGGVAAIEVLEAGEGFFEPVTWIAAGAGAVVPLVLLGRADRQGRRRRSVRPRPRPGTEGQA